MAGVEVYRADTMSNFYRIPQRYYTIHSPNKGLDFNSGASGMAKLGALIQPLLYKRKTAEKVAGYRNRDRPYHFSE